MCSGEVTWNLFCPMNMFSTLLLLPITRIVTSPIGVGMNAKSAKLKEIFSEKLRFNTFGMDEDN